MTRLTQNWMTQLVKTMDLEEGKLKQVTGYSYRDLFKEIAGLNDHAVDVLCQRIKIGVVPVTSGEGIIGNFSEAVKISLEALGFQVFVTGNSDVEGLYEAHHEKADFIFMADDERFIGWDIKGDKMIDNDEGTSRAYVTLLEKKAESLQGKNILLLGYGRIGKWVARLLREKQSLIYIYDHNPLVLKGAEEQGYHILETTTDFNQFPYIFDATSEGEWLESSLLCSHPIIAAPGVPLSLTAEGMKQLEDQIIHDKLSIGVVGMMSLLVHNHV